MELQSMSISERVGRTFNSLAVYNYRLFSASQLISLSGTWMQTTAQGWLVLKISNSAVALGTVVALQYFPIALLTLFGGALADRLPKRTVLVGTQSLAATQALLLALLVLTNMVHLWQLYVLALLLGTINAFDSPTRQAFVSELVGPDRLQNAIALNSSLFNTARIVGPALAGIVISVVGIGPAFLFNALSFIPVIAALLLLHREELHTSAHAVRNNIFRQVGEGIRYAVRTPNILIVLLALAFIGTLGYNYPIVLPLLAKFVLQAGATGLGALTSAVGVGALMGAIVMASARRASEQRVLVAGLLFSILLMAVGLSDDLPATLLLLAAMGGAGIVYTSSSNTRLQSLTPGPLRGRVMSLYLLLGVGTTPIGGFLVGVLSARFGVQLTIALMGAGCLLGIIAVIAYARRTGSSPTLGRVEAQLSVDELEQDLRV
jgi:MFS family permease